MENRLNAQTTAAAAGSMLLAARALFFKTKFFLSWRAAQMGTRARHSCGVLQRHHYRSDSVQIAISPRGGSLCQQQILKNYKF